MTEYRFRISIRLSDGSETEVGYISIDSDEVVTNSMASAEVVDELEYLSDKKVYRFREEIIPEYDFKGISVRLNSSRSL